MARFACFVLAVTVALAPLGAHAQGHGGMGGHAFDGHESSGVHHDFDHDHDHDFDHRFFFHDHFFFGGGAFFDGYYPYAYEPYYYPYYYPPAVVYAPPATEVSVSATPVAGGANCREFQTTVTIDGKRQAAVGTACRQADGTWRVSR